MSVQAGLPGQVGVSIAGLRIGFDVRHDRSKSMATATINIYNPLPETVSFFEDRDALVRLFAGSRLDGTILGNRLTAVRPIMAAIVTDEARNTRKYFWARLARVPGPWRSGP